jgi:mannose-6-phosphate isomerase
MLQEKRRNPMGKAEVIMKPLRLKPVYVKSIWAGRRLRSIRNLSEEGIGISREVCAYKNSENIIAEGEYAGKSIKDLIDNNHKELLGDDPQDQLVRVAYIDAVEDLSIQVHPKEKYAKELKDYEKSESWYILEAEEGAYITAGVKINDKEILRQAAENGTLEQYIHRIPVKEGDFALIPAGMLHACGKNMLAIEIGSFGGITYRIYDYGRPRALDLDNSFLILDTALQCEIKHFPLLKEPENRVQTGVEHSLFHVDILDIAEEIEIKSDKYYYILTCVKGNCTIQYDKENYPLSYTETLLIPASTGAVTIKGHCRVLKSYYPR